MERVACRYNLGVNCTEQTNCQRCGWNPQVECYRKKHQKLPETPPQGKKWIIGKGNCESLEKLA